MRRVLLLHTGGTLGMRGEPMKPGEFLADLDSAVPELGRIADLETRIVCNLDSSDMGPAQWSRLAQVVAAERDQWDGFVITHGTDTMAYSASALAFVLRGLDRPVVFTGAQRPLSKLRSDAPRNLQDAVELATLSVPEVGICFDGLFLRGCRSVKNDARSYRAFASPGLEPLVRFGFDVAVGRHVRRPVEPFACDPRFDAAVAVMYVSPGFREDWIRRLVDSGEVRGLVFAAFGVGTTPTVSSGIGAAVQYAVEAGVDVLVVTQWGGMVDLGLYANSAPLREAGAISGGKMRIEAAVPKLMHALAIFDNRDDRRAWLERDVAGEQD